jgi:hypothetical protein
MISWCPLGAVILGGQKMASLDLRREEDQQKFGEILVENEIACPRCFAPYVCQLDSIIFAKVVAKVSCTQCGFKFRWYASEAAWLVYEQDADQDLAGIYWRNLLMSECDKPEERDTAPRSLQERVAEFRCPICREDLLHPIRYRPGLVRVVCRNSSCRQQWGFNPEQAVSTQVLSPAAVGGAA